MNNRNKIRFLIAFLVVLTGLVGLEGWRMGMFQNGTLSLSLGGIPKRIPNQEDPGHSWAFESKGLVFGLVGGKSMTLMIFANKFWVVHRNIVVVASALVVIPALYAVVFSWIIILRRRMKAQSPGAGSAERPDH